MKTPEDIVWDEITASAKTRFDYGKFERGMADLGNEHAPENLIFTILVGYADDQAPAEIASRIHRDLLLLGFGFPKEELLKFVEDKKEAFSLEIKATRSALAAFDMGAKVPGVLVQTRSILKKYGA